MKHTRNRLLSLLLSVCVLLTAFSVVLPVSLTASAAIFKGDADQSGAINATDVRLVLRYMVTGAPDATAASAADFNGDNAITSTDARLLLTYSMNPHTDVATLADGVYSLTLQNTDTATDVYYFGTADSTNIGSSDYVGNAAQQVYLMNTGDGVVFWTMCTTGSVLSVGNNRNVEQRTAAADPSTQKWYLQTAANGGYAIRSFVTGTALTLSDDGNVCIAGYTGAASQIWTITPQTTAVRYATATVSLNCRSGAGASNSSYGAIAEGAMAVITGSAQDGWYPVVAFDETTGALMMGYASGTYLSFFNPNRVFVPEEDDNYGKTDISEELYSLIDSFVSSHTGVDGWQVYVEPLNTGDSYAVNYTSDSYSGTQISASLIKLWTMGAVYQQADAGNISLTSTVNSNLHQMIIVSDNDANNTLVKTTLGGGNASAGFAKVNSFAASIGCADTTMNRLMLVSDGTQNWTSAADCATFLRQCYNGELPYSSEMITHLKGQQVSTKITASNGITANIDIAHKTGELTGTAEHDVGIVFDSQAGGADFLLCIMTDPAASNNAAADTQIAQLSAQIYTLMHNTYAG